MAGWGPESSCFEKVVEAAPPMDLWHEMAGIPLQCLPMTATKALQQLTSLVHCL